MSTKLMDLIMLRQSVRRYADKPVEKEKLDRCLEAALMAPSACNAQPWKFIVVDDTELVKNVAKETWNRLVTFNKFVDQAPVIIVITIEKSPLVPTAGRILKDKEYPLIDIGIAAEHFCLQATEEGLGTCMLGWFNEKPIQKLLGIPKNRRIGLLISLGYEPVGYKMRKKIRKGIDQVVSYNKY
jgi:nitroreductase